MVGFAAPLGLSLLASLPWLPLGTAPARAALGLELWRFFAEACRRSTTAAEYE